MKRQIRIIIFMATILLISITYGIILKLSENRQTNSKRIHQPKLSTVRFIKDTPMIDGKPTLIILFNSECEHCQYEAGQLQKRHSEFKTANVYMLTTEAPVRAQAFARHYGLDTLSIMHVGTLTQEEAYKAFGPT